MWLTFIFGIKEYIRQWIIVKTMNAIRYLKIAEGQCPKPGPKPRIVDAPNLPDGTLQDQPSAYDRTFWDQYTKWANKTHVNIRALAESLGLEYEKSNNSKKFVFKDQKGRDLQCAILKISEVLPQSENKLIDMAIS